MDKRAALTPPSVGLRVKIFPCQQAKSGLSHCAFDALDTASELAGG